MTTPTASSTTTPTTVFSCVHIPTFTLHAACEHIRDIPVHPHSRNLTRSPPRRRAFLLSATDAKVLGSSYEPQRRDIPWDPRSPCTRRSGSCRRTTTSVRRRRHGPVGDGSRRRLGGDYPVHDPVLLRLLGRHEEIAV